jgi:mannosylglucosylglycerate synthase
MDTQRMRIGFIATRLSGTDGVSLETNKWVNILQGLGHECFCFCGESDWPEESVHMVPEANMKHPEILKIDEMLFKDKKRSGDTSRAIHKLKEHLKAGLYRFAKRFDLDLLIVENALSLPMNVPLGIALAEFIGETSMHTIAHHHDFWWERTRYIKSPADDYLRSAFPCTMSSVYHVVINSIAARELAFRTGIGSILIPNVMDFDSPPSLPDGYANDMRQELGIKKGTIILLQPTRIVPRKKIERAIALARRINTECVLVVTHTGDDEGIDYRIYLKEFANLIGVNFLCAADRFAFRRQTTSDGRKVYSIADAYSQADLVTYPSVIEGFGNAFLETIYYRRPIIMEAYEIFKCDIQPKGFKVIWFEDFISQKIVEDVQKMLCNHELAIEWVEKNYQLGRRYYSYQTLEKRLVTLLDHCIRNW